MPKPLLDAIEAEISASDGWRVVERNDRLVKCVPEALLSVLPRIGAPGPAPRSAWLTLNFWVQSPTGGLGRFWRSAPVADKRLRDRVLQSLLENATGSRFVYKGRGDWRVVGDPAFGGDTISGAWWPKAGSPSIPAATATIREELRFYSGHATAMANAIRAAVGPVEAAPAPIPVHRTASSALPPVRSLVAHSAMPKGRTTPPIPADIRGFRHASYMSIFEIYADEPRLYGTEDLYGDWDAPVLLLAKDAGSSRNFLPASQGGLGWAWVHNPARPTNRNLRPLADTLPCGKLYASFLACLLRTDDRESGDLPMDDRVRAFVRRVFLWTVDNMPHLHSVAVLGQESWREVMTAVRSPAATNWKRHHLNGEPVGVQIGDRTVEFYAMNHPARIPAHKLMQQPAWLRLLHRCESDK